MADCNSPYPDGAQEVTYNSEAGFVSLKVLYVDNNIDPEIDTNSRVCFMVAGQDETANFNFDHPSLFTAPGSEVICSTSV